MRNLHTVATISIALAATTVGFALPGCSSPKERARDRMLDQASDFRESVKKIPPQLEEVNRRMGSACQGQNPSRAQDVREFSKSLEKLREQGLMVASEANKAEVDANKYFTAWAKESQRAKAADRPEIRAGAKVSRAQVDTALRYLDRARSDFRELVTTLERIEAQLKADQSEASIMAIQKSDFGKAQVKTMDLRNYLDRLTETIDAAVAAK